MPFFEFLTGKKSYMQASFATDQWRKSLPPMTFGHVFSALENELLWALETTVSDEGMRTDLAENLAIGCDWLSNACVSASIANTHEQVRHSVRAVDGLTGYDILCLPTTSVSLADQEEFAERVPQVWSSVITKDQAMEYIDLAVTRWYATTGQPGALLVIELEGVGKFYLVPKSRSKDFMSNMGLLSAAQ